MLNDEVFHLLTSGKSVFLVGKSDSGKTYFAKNELIPFLKNRGLDVHYFKDCDDLTAPMAGIAVVDEVESFQDREFLENAHPNEKPYYEDAYIQKVNGWLRKLSSISNPAVYILSRNSDAEIQNFIKTIRKTDWNDGAVEVLKFERQS